MPTRSVKLKPDGSDLLKPGTALLELLEARSYGGQGPPRFVAPENKWEKSSLYTSKQFIQVNQALASTTTISPTAMHQTSTWDVFIIFLEAETETQLCVVACSSPAHQGSPGFCIDEDHTLLLAAFVLVWTRCNGPTDLGMACTACA